MNFKIKPFRFLWIGMVVIVIGALAKIMKEPFYQPIFIAGLSIELISIILIFKKLNYLIKYKKHI